MKTIKHYLTLSAAVALALHAAHAAADFASDADTALNWGEKSFPQFLPSHESSQNFDVWRFRFYKQTNLIVGINSQDNGVYTMINSPGQKPAFFAKLADVLKNISAGNDQVCDQAQSAAGFSFTTAGDTTKISTNGQCVKVPKGAICAPPATATGISVLSKNDIKNFSFQGLKFKEENLGKVVEPTIKDAVNVQTCIKNAPEKFAKQKFELDVCLDVSDQMKDFSAFESFFTVTPPVTITMQGNMLNELADPQDCFKTDAKIVYDALTKETWTKVNGQFVKQ